MGTMTRDDIIRLAKEAYKDLVTVDYPGHVGQLDPWTLRLLERFAALVAEREREACAKACEARKIIEPDYEDQRHYNQGIEHCAAAIRARGEA